MSTLRSTIGRRLIIGVLWSIPSISLVSQPLSIEWPREFAFPGPADVIAVAAEGDEVVALNSKGLHRFADGQWEAPIPVEGLARTVHHPDVALHQGRVWVVDGDGHVKTWDGIAWKDVSYENSFGFGLYPPSLLSHDGELYLLPIRYRWDGTTFQPTLPDLIGRVDAAAVSRSGDWLLASEEDQLSQLTGGELRLLPALPLEDAEGSWPYLGGVAFYGDVPVVFTSAAVYRLEGTRWVRTNTGLSSVEDIGPFELVNSRPIIPSRFGARLIVAMRGELLGHLSASSTYGFPFKHTCQNRLYELRDNRWHRLDAISEGRINEIAFSGEDEYLVAGEFKSWDVPAIGNGVIRMGSEGFSPVTGRPQRYAGIAGEIETVLTDGNMLFVGGAVLSAHALDPVPLLRYDGSEWHAESAVGGDVGDLELFEGLVYAAGDLIVDGESGALAVRENGLWRLLEDVSHRVTAITAADGQLLVAGRAPAGGGVGGISRVRNGTVTSVLSDIDFDVADVAEFAGSIYVASSSGSVFEVTSGTLQEVATVSGGPVIWRTDDPGSSSAVFTLDSIVRPSIKTLHRHRDALYVGGTFDSINGVPASNIARFDGQSWSSFDSGVTGRSNVVYWKCTGLDREAKVDDLIPTVNALASAGDYLVVAGLFTHVGTRDIPSTGSQENVHLALSRKLGGMEVGFPVALFNPVTSQWEPVADTGGESVSSISFDGGRLAVAGDILEVAGVAARGVALSDQFISAPVTHGPIEVDLTQNDSVHR